MSGHAHSYQEKETRRAAIRTWIGIAICVAVLLACVPVGLYVMEYTDKQAQVKANIEIAQQYESRGLLHQAYAEYRSAMALDPHNRAALDGCYRIQAKWNAQIAIVRAAQQAAEEAARREEEQKRVSAEIAARLAASSAHPGLKPAAGNIYTGVQIYSRSGRYVGKVVDIGHYTDPWTGDRRRSVILESPDGSWHIKDREALVFEWGYVKPEQVGKTLERLHW